MAHWMTMLLGVVVAMAMVVAGMWAWNEARWLGERTHQPDVTLWAARSAAVALAAGAQAIFATYLAAGQRRRDGFRRDGFSRMLRFGAGAIAAIALVSAIALGLVGR